MQYMYSKATANTSGMHGMCVLYIDYEKCVREAARYFLSLTLIVLWGIWVKAICHIVLPAYPNRTTARGSSPTAGPRVLVCACVLVIIYIN